MAGYSCATQIEDPATQMSPPPLERAPPSKTTCGLLLRVLTSGSVGAVLSFCKCALNKVCAPFDPEEEKKNEKGSRASKARI
uniref:Uncharacterized protein n=1 Tax=Oryza nivara TaxID=4536 RepID=A0A0E0J6I6_ORYNI